MVTLLLMAIIFVVILAVMLTVLATLFASAGGVLLVLLDIAIGIAPIVLVCFLIKKMSKKSKDKKEKD